MDLRLLRTYMRLPWIWYLMFIRVMRMVVIYHF